MTDTIAATFLAFSVKRMRLSQRDIDRCVDQLTDEQIFHRNTEHENSIANLLIHLEGNLRQWFLHGIDGQSDVRQRDAEFSLTPAGTVAEIRASFAATLDECCTVIGTLNPDRLLTAINPQPTGNWGALPMLEAIYQIVGHLQMHTGQIILLTKQLTNRDLDLSMPRKR